MGDTEQQSNLQDKGWSKYELIVLQSLENNTQMVKTLLYDVNTINQRLAIMDVVQKNWRENYDKGFVELQEEIEDINKNAHDLDVRLKAVELENVVEEKTDVKTKGYWVFIGGIAMMLIDLAYKTAAFFYHK